MTLTQLINSSKLVTKQITVIESMMRLEDIDFQFTCSKKHLKTLNDIIRSSSAGRIDNMSLKTPNGSIVRMGHILLTGYDNSERKVKFTVCATVIRIDFPKTVSEKVDNHYINDFRDRFTMMPPHRIQVGRTKTTVYNLI